jgi:hypothetical protein
MFRTVWATPLCGVAGWLGDDRQHFAHSRNFFSRLALDPPAAAKSRLVILHYMEANRAARHWRFLYETWNFAATATIVIGYLVSRVAA